MILVLGAVIFLVLVFLTKNQTIFKKEKNQDIVLDEAAYTTETVGNIIGKDTDGDGMLDWEEGLWGTDPTKKDTDGDGVNDDVEIALLKKADNSASNSSSPTTDLPTPTTETDKFTDNLMTTVAALAQSGSLDDTTIDNITTSLVSQMKNSTPQKIWTVKNIKIETKENNNVFQQYKNQILEIQKKYPINIDIGSILVKSINSDGEIDLKDTKEIDANIKMIDGIIKELLTVVTPQSVSVLHVVIINNFQKISENFSNIKKMNDDPLLAFVAMSQYEENFTRLGEYSQKLMSLIEEKLKN